MNPAFSVVFFTTLAGTGQGLVVTLAVARLAGVALDPGFVGASLLVALVLLVVGLGASFLHLGRPERAWRAAMMWRTSWLSREVIALPVFIALVALWWWLERRGVQSAVLPVVAIAMAALLWYCTAMIYACIRFIQEWAHPLTLVNYTLIGLASGAVASAAIAAASGSAGFAHAVAPWALALTLVAWATRVASLRRNAALKHRSTLQSATGIRHPQLVQKSMGMSAGAFNTREFFHGVSLAALRQVKLGFLLLGFALPAVLVAAGWWWGAPAAYWLAVVVQAVGLLAERWFFFAQARHPQNLYYQVVS